MLTLKPQTFQRRRAQNRPRFLLIGLGLASSLIFAATAAANWTAKIQPDPITRQQRCLLESDAVTTAAGHDDTTPVVLVFNGETLMVKTQSELDPSFADLQLVVDKNTPMRSDKIVQKKFLSFEQNLPDLIKQLREGRQLTVYLRFWPTWPATQSFPIQFSLAGFSKMHDAMNQNCQPSTGTNPPSR